MKRDLAVRALATLIVVMMGLGAAASSSTTRIGSGAQNTTWRSWFNDWMR